MLQAMLAGVASIKAQQTRMNVIGNNLANVNTTAFKTSRITFQDMLAQTIRGATRPSATSGGTNPIQFGLGVLVAGTDVNNEQGSLQATNRPTDFAIQGSGLFMVSNATRIGYTRDGAFDLDATGDLVHRATGERMLGWTADPATGNVDTNAPISPSSYLNIPLGARTAVQVTTNVTWAGNLDSGEFLVAGQAATNAIVEIIDPLGGVHTMTMTLTEHATDPNKWTWAVAGSGATGMAAVSPGDLVFNSATGELTGGSPGDVLVTPDGATGIAPFTISMDFSALSQLATQMQVTSSSQNGFTPGSLSSFSIGADGVITGLYTNGLTRTLGLVATAIFPNANGLERLGNNLWRNTDNSGIAVVGAPKSGGRGSINSGFLEQSNVDIGNEFTDLIITQRGFQANTKVVVTVDEMLQDLINMKR